MTFKITHQDGEARVGKLKTAHGYLETPFYMPVATKAGVKLVDSLALKEMKAECIISNSLVLYYTPGLDILKKAGKVHKFMNWNKGIFTDSGGFQTLNPYFNHKTNDKGAYFKNPSTGKTELITPEKAMEIQNAIGSDVAMVLDDVPHYGKSKKDNIEMLKRTHDWAKRCKVHHGEIKGTTNSKQLLFGIGQGGTYKDLRRKSIEYLESLNFDGLALGGLAIGEPTKSMFDMIKYSIRQMPKEKPRYLMGVGSPDDIIESIFRGVDCFDSTFPTMNARHGTLFTFNGKIKITNSKYKEDFKPIDEKCNCKICKNYTRAYIHHLMRSGQFLGMQLASYHNVYFMMDLIRKIKTAIKENRLTKYKKEFLKSWSDKNKSHIGTGVAKMKS